MNASDYGHWGLSVTKKRPVKDVAIEIFIEIGEPIHYKELTNMLIDKCHLSGKTPHESVRSLIGADKRFKRTAEGVYALSEWDKFPIARFAKDISFDVLKNHGKAMPVNDLGDAILNERDFVGSPRLSLIHI